MFSRLDHYLFPDKCEVYQVEEGRQYIYPIFKNGSSTLVMAAEENRWKILFNEQIKRVRNIDVYLRDPADRLNSGIATYVNQLKQDRPELDEETILFFVENHPFINRHLTPQFHWLINLSRYTARHTLLNFKDINQMSSLTEVFDNPYSSDKRYPEIVDKILSHEGHYLLLDQFLIKEFLGRSVTFRDIMSSFQYNYPVVYDEIFGHAQTLAEATDVLS